MSATAWAAVLKWAKASIAASHAAKTFTLFGLVFDKFDALIAITALVILTVVLAVTAAAVHPLLTKINNRSH
jgi:hypothetical protein